jgi:hypothetical protein
MSLNYGFLATVEIPDLSFDDILRLWPNAPDADEHDMLAAMPFRGDLIRDCLASPRLPESLFPELRRSAAFDGLKPEDHAWHPTSTARLALALWLLEQQGAVIAK